jgi:hypothetical protein
MTDYTELVARLRALKGFDIYREAADAALESFTQRLSESDADLAGTKTLTAPL